MKLFYDLETTGLPKYVDNNIYYPPEQLDKYDTSRIIELGLVLVNNKGDIVEKYNAIIKPNNFTKLEPIITKLTGLTDQDILKGKDLKDVIEEIKPFFKRVSTINAYNIKFDYNVLLSEMYRIHDKEMIQILIDAKQECTFDLSKKILYIGSYKMEKVYKELFKVDPKQDHRAFNDAILCKEVYYKLKEVYKENKNKNKNKK